jgi:hypothetical protein
LGSDWQLLLKAAEEHFVFGMRKTQLYKLKQIFSKVHASRSEPNLLQNNLATKNESILQNSIIGIPTSKSITKNKSKDILNYSYIDLYDLDPFTIADLIAKGHLDPLKLDANLLDELIANEYLLESVHKPQKQSFQDCFQNAGDLLYDINYWEEFLTSFSPTLYEKFATRWEELDTLFCIDLTMVLYLSANSGTFSPCQE